MKNDDFCSQSPSLYDNPNGTHTLSVEWIYKFNKISKHRLPLGNINIFSFQVYKPKKFHMK